MWMQNLGGAQVSDNYSTPATVNQNNSLIGAPQIQTAAAPTFDVGALNSTAIQNPDVVNMVKALKGGM